MGWEDSLEEEIATHSNILAWKIFCLENSMDRRAKGDSWVAPSHKESACNAGYPGSIPGSGRSPTEGHGNPLQYSCQENFMDRAAWWATVDGLTKSWT